MSVQIKPPRKYYEAMTVEERQCRAGRIHNFAKPDPRLARLPRGFRIRDHDRHGNYYVQQDCLSCGLERHGIWRWLRGHFQSVPKSWRYVRPEGWVRVPWGVLTPSMIMGFLMDDCKGQIDAAVAQLDAGDVPQVKLSG